MEDDRGRTKAALWLRAGWTEDAVLAELVSELGLSAPESATELLAAKRMNRTMDRALVEDRQRLDRSPSSGVPPEPGWPQDRVTNHGS